MELGALTAEDEEWEDVELFRALYVATRGSVIALTTSNELRIYGVQLLKEPVYPWGGDALKDLYKVDVHLKSTLVLDQGGLATCLYGSSQQILVAYSNGLLAGYSWSGRLREGAEPLLDLLTEQMSFSEVGEDPPEEPPCIVDLDFCEASRTLALLLNDGSVAICKAGGTSASLLDDLVVSHWLCGPEGLATCVRIGSHSQLIAVGLVTGQVALYRQEPYAGLSIASSPKVQATGSNLLVRVLGLEDWGHKEEHTGGVTCMAWSPDCRVLAVGFQLQGLVVWSPSGCRLMCSLRQNPQGPSGPPASKEKSDPPQPPVSEDAGGEANEQQVLVPRGITSLCWGPLGYQLMWTESGRWGHLLEISFAQVLPRNHRVAFSTHRNGIVSNESKNDELHVLQAHNSLLLVTESTIRTAGTGAFSEVWGFGPGDDSGSGSDLLVRYVPLPASYISANWPIKHAAVSASGMDIVVAGVQGLATYSRHSERWRLFGDISQERKVTCTGLTWVENMIAACSTTPGSSSSSGPTCDLLLFPRTHLDFTSLLARRSLPQIPLVVTSINDFILLAFDPLDLVLMRAQIKPAGQTGSTSVVLSTVRQLSIFNVERSLLDVALVPMTPSLKVAASEATVQGQANGKDATAASDGPTPRQCVLLRQGGHMSVLDMEKGSEVVLSTDVECFWLSDNLKVESSLGYSRPPSSTPSRNTSRGNLLSAANSRNDLEGMEGLSELSERVESPSGEDDTSIEMPWWAYGPGGMQLWFPSALKGSMSTRIQRRLSETLTPSTTGTDMELEFDREVYPVGISLADAAIIGITQRLVQGHPIPGVISNQVQGPGVLKLPWFHPIPESQPVLPCLLRRLLQHGAFEEALALAHQHAQGPHFGRSLEWLLFTSLELETSRPKGMKKLSSAGGARRSWSLNGSSPEGPRSPPSPNSSNLLGPASTLLRSAAELLQQFPQYSDVVVSVARKTDAALWPTLFSAIGSPSMLLEGLLETGALKSAACFLLVVDRLEGADRAYGLTYRLVQAALKTSQFYLVAELLRFLMPPGECDAALLTNRPSQQAELAFDVNLPDAQQEGEEQSASDATAVPSKPTAVDSAGPTADKGSSSYIGWLSGWLWSSSSAQSPAPQASTTQAEGGAGPEQKVAEVEQQDREDPSLVPANTACQIIAEYAWSLLDQGKLAALAQLTLAMAFLSGGLGAMMVSHGDERQQEPLEAVTSMSLFSALGRAVQELPVWEGEETEQSAVCLHELCSQLHCWSWRVALAVLTVDLQVIGEVKSARPEMWQELTSLLRSEPAYYYLLDIVDLVVNSEDQKAEGKEEAPAADGGSSTA